MGKKKILFVDDEAKFVRAVKLNLEETGEYEVRTETEGEKTLAAVKEFKPDLIFLDIVMPDVDGGEVAQRIKADETLKGIPIVFLTALAKQEEEKIRDGSIGGHLLAKPVTTERLIECIKKYAK
jgi:CheY-like chemotaxis protein